MRIPDVGCQRSAPRRLESGAPRSDGSAVMARVRRGKGTEDHRSDDQRGRHDAAGTRQVARGGLANLIGAAYSGVASFAITVMVTRIASSEQAGIYFSAVSILLIAVGLAQVGVPVGYVYFLARYRGLDQPRRYRSILVAGAVPMLVIGGGLVLGGILFREPLGSLLFGDDVDGSAKIMGLVSGALLVAICAESALGATRGLGVMRPTVVAEKFFNPTVQLLALVLLAVLGHTDGSDLVWTRALGFAAMAVIAVPWLFRLLRRKSGVGVRDKGGWDPVSKSGFVEFWRFTAPRALGQLAQVGIQRVDIVLVGLWLGPSEAAVYAAASRFLVFGQLAGRAIGTSIQPRISMLVAQGGVRPLQDLYKTSTAWVMFATWPLYLTFIVQAEWLMRVFGEEYSRGAPVLQLLSSAMLFATACGAVDAVLLMAGRSSWAMMNAWISLVANVSLNVWLIPRWGIAGAALAWTVSIVLSNLLPLVQVKFGVGVHPFGRITFYAAIVPVVLFALIPWIVDYAGGELIGAIVAFLVCGAIYGALLWRWRHDLGLTGLLKVGVKRNVPKD